MQTFLPYPDFAQSASVLDPKRLNKQIVEGNQILKTLLTDSHWRHHPAVLQFKGYEKCLQNYIDFHLMEAHKRGFKTEKSLANLNELTAAHKDKLGNVELKAPSWLGDDRFHSSHRSRLLFKGRVDSVYGQLKSFLKVRSVNTWLKANNYSEKNYFKQLDIKKLEEFCKNKFDLLPTNYYAQFGWSEDDTQDYYWPVKFEKTENNN